MREPCVGNAIRSIFAILAYCEGSLLCEVVIRALGSMPKYHLLFALTFILTLAGRAAVDSILELRGATVSYPSFTLGPVSFQVKRGEIFGLVGANGAGKTTLLESILGMRKLSGGHIFMHDRDLAGSHSCEEKAHLGFVVGGTGFCKSSTPVRIGSILKGIYPKWDQAAYVNYLSHFKINPQKRLDSLSSGTTKKLKLCCAYAHHPDLLVLDEITSGLDPAARLDVLHLLRLQTKGSNCAHLISTHITDDLIDIADVVGYLRRGKLVFAQPACDFKHHELDELIYRDAQGDSTCSAY